MAGMFGVAEKELIGTNYIQWVHSDDLERSKAIFRQIINFGTVTASYKNRQVTRRGVIWTRWDAVPLKDASGLIIGCQATCQDITERKQAEEELKLRQTELTALNKRLRFLSTRDSLTGLYNRHFFEEEMQRLQDSRYYPISIIVADVDGLKLVNDTLGHSAGDRLLKAAARAIGKPFRKSDVVARIGGDEFAVVLPRIPLDTARAKCREIWREVDSINKNNPSLHLSISLGASTALSTQTTLEDVFKQADAEMYRDKQKRKLEGEHL